MLCKVFVLIFLSSLSLKAFAVLQPETPEVLTTANASDFELSGYCNPGGGDVSIDFGSLSLTTPCKGILGVYNFEGDVSSETTTNPIRHCVTQPPVSTVCSQFVDNQLASPGVVFDLTPLQPINSDNETSYTITGTCAPVGNAVTVNLGSGALIINDFCLSGNRFFITSDVSALPDGVGLSATVTAGGGSLDSTTVDKVSGVTVPNPVVLSVSSSVTDLDADTWLEAGDSALLSVQFSEPVNVTGTVTLDVSLTSGLKSLALASGSGTDTLTFLLPVVTNDEQCNGDVSLIDINVGAGSVLSVATSEQASFQALPTEVNVEKIDAEAPTFEFGVDLFGATATFTASVEFTGEDFRGEDNCVVPTNLEGSIGTTSGGSEVIPFSAIPAGVNSYRFEDGVDGFSVNLVTGVDYFISLRAIDEAGNISLVNSSPAWSVSPIFVIPNLIVHLDGREPSSILDGAGNDVDSVSFDGFIQTMLDISGSTTDHDFTATSVATRPAYNSIETSIAFDGVNDYLTTPNHPDINTGTVNQRSFSAVFTLGSNVNARQMIFEEGGGVRGMNLYVDNGDIYCGFWNNRNDGDGVQPFVSQSAPVVANQGYNITSVFDYTNFAGAGGPDGTFTCYINGVAMGPAIPITSRLFAHSGDVNLGRNGDGTLVHTGADGAQRFFNGELNEFVMFNAPPDAALALDLHNFFQGKWGY